MTEKVEGVKPSEEEKKNLSKYLADCLFFSFHYSQGSAAPQKLFFQYFAHDLSSQKIEMGADLWDEVQAIARKQVEARIDKYSHMDEMEGNMYVYPPNHPSLINTDPALVFFSQFLEMKTALTAQIDSLPPKNSIILKLASQLINRDLAWVTSGRPRQKDKNADPYQSHLRDYALLHHRVPGPDLYAKVFEEVGEQLRELLKSHNNELPAVNVDILFERHKLYLAFLEQQKKRFHKIKLLFALTKPAPPVLTIEWLAALKQAWEKKHPGESFIPEAKPQTKALA